MVFERVGLSLCFVLGCTFAFTALDKDNFPDESLLPFRIGNGLGWVGNDWDDGRMTNLSTKAGYDGQRKKLPEYHLVQWGYGIEVGDCQTANKVGVYDIVGYLCGPSEDHSNAPTYNTNTREIYPPKNLYEPIFVDGKVNENNYWADYIAKTVTQYKDYVRIWEVWNEPDYVVKHEVVGNWSTQPPNPDDLTHWHASIFEYNRLMRITYEVVKSIDPTAWIATGGLGYTNFLDAMLRYTDNPVDGSVSDDYPLKGGAYFDCLCYHKYPQWGETDERTHIGYHGKASDNLAMKFVTIKRNMEYRLEKYGFDGKTYPRKMFICTETGLTTDATEPGTGGDVIRRNFVIKNMLYAHEYDVKQTHWLYLVDSNYKGMADFYNLGKYVDSSSIDNAAPKDSSKGRVVWTDLHLSKMSFDEKKTAEAREMLSSLGNNFTATVMKPNKNKWPYSPNETIAKEQPDAVYVFWRRSDYDDEINDTVSLSFKKMKWQPPVEVYKYDGSHKTYDSLDFELKIDSTPVFVIPSKDVSKDVSNEESLSGSSTLSVSLIMLLLSLAFYLSF